MKYIVFLNFYIWISNLSSQIEYKWINHPTISGILNEFEENERDYRLLNGKVKEMEVLFYHSSAIEPYSKLRVKYTENGQIYSYLKVSVDTESGKEKYYLKVLFMHDNNNTIQKEIVSKRIDGKKISPQEINENVFFSAFPDPITKDQFGNSLSIAFDKDTTYSFYDVKGRKTMDSIPIGSFSTGLKNKYMYLNDTIYCHKMWFANSDVPSEREAYLLDSKGNWIEKKIFWDNDLTWTYRTKRSIIYYE